ncbi:MAG: PQQ-dependent sugar dehydrogenase [Planctomycetales bacterium]|nr:PQQ-dependent sugar dehydrogenase [Planctomycetales bacterium]
MRRLNPRPFYFAVVFVCAGVAIAAEVDTSPLEVKIVDAFPQLKWPDTLTGANRGLTEEVIPIVITGAGDGTDRLFVATQHGTIHVMPPDRKGRSAKTFLDIRERVHYNPDQNEEGFLGFAFHPRYKENGEFFVHYTLESASDQREAIISRFRVSADDPNQADPDSEEVILRVPQPYWNHNGGTVVFGPDGFLYIVFGDGGAGNDPHMNGQNLQTLLGAVLRIDVDRQDEDLAYAIPPDNPFVNLPKLARPEIWAYGLRNVWRLSFDRETGVCWGADVGQGLWEEINLIQRGGNYGWNLREGRHPFGPGGVGPQDRLIEPIWEYHHDVGKSITGGHVYRGSRVPQLQGAYLYADYVAGQVWALRYDFDAKRVTSNRVLRSSGSPVVTFGEDDQGEVYFSNRIGDIYTFQAP